MKPVLFEETKEYHLYVSEDYCLKCQKYNLYSKKKNDKFVNKFKNCRILYQKTNSIFVKNIKTFLINKEKCKLYLLFKKEHTILNKFTNKFVKFFKTT